MRLPPEPELAWLVASLHALVAEWEGPAHPDKAAGSRDAAAQLREVLAQLGHREPPLSPVPWTPRRA